jgi:hypothetical protein
MQVLRRNVRNFRGQVRVKSVAACSSATGVVQTYPPLRTVIIASYGLMHRSKMLLYTTGLARPQRFGADDRYQPSSVRRDACPRVAALPYARSELPARSPRPDTCREQGRAYTPAMCQLMRHSKLPLTDAEIHRLALTVRTTSGRAATPPAANSFCATVGRTQATGAMPPAVLAIIVSISATLGLSILVALSEGLDLGSPRLPP